MEQEKREQEKQAGTVPTEGVGAGTSAVAAGSAASSPLLSDADFERLRAEVLATPRTGVSASPPHALPGMLINNILVFM